MSDADNINLYSEMNEQISELLELSGEGINLYAAKLIKTQQIELQKYRQLEEKGQLIKLPYRLNTKEIIFLDNDGNVSIMHCGDKKDCDKMFNTLNWL